MQYFYYWRLLENRLHKKWSFPLWTSSVNVTKSAENCVFGYIYSRNENFIFCAVYNKLKEQIWKKKRPFNTSLLFLIASFQINAVLHKWQICLHKPEEKHIKQVNANHCSFLCSWKISKTLHYFQQSQIVNKMAPQCWIWLKKPWKD